MANKWIRLSPVKKIAYTNIPIVQCPKCGFQICDILNDVTTYAGCPHCLQALESPDAEKNEKVS